MDGSVIARKRPYLIRLITSVLVIECFKVVLYDIKSCTDHMSIKVDILKSCGYDVFLGIRVNMFLMYQNKNQYFGVIFELNAGNFNYWY